MKSITENQWWLNVLKTLSKKSKKVAVRALYSSERLQSADIDRRDLLVDIVSSS